MYRRTCRVRWQESFIYAAKKYSFRQMIIPLIYSITSTTEADRVHYWVFLKSVVLDAGSDLVHYVLGNACCLKTVLTWTILVPKHIRCNVWYQTSRQRENHVNIDIGQRQEHWCQLSLLQTITFLKIYFGLERCVILLWGKPQCTSGAHVVKMVWEVTWRCCYVMYCDVYCVESVKEIRRFCSSVVNVNT